MRAKNRNERMQEQNDERGKEAPKAVQYVLCDTTLSLPKPPVQAGSHPPFGLTKLLIPGPVRCQEVSWQGEESPSLPDLQL